LTSENCGDKGCCRWRQLGYWFCGRLTCWNRWGIGRCCAVVIIGGNRWGTGRCCAAVIIGGFCRCSRRSPRRRWDGLVRGKIFVPLEFQAVFQFGVVFFVGRPIIKRQWLKSFGTRRNGTGALRPNTLCAGLGINLDQAVPLGVFRVLARGKGAVAASVVVLAIGRTEIPNAVIHLCEIFVRPFALGYTVINSVGHKL
jgi:hypothetical protein